MQVTKEMQEMMERTMEQYFAAYWQKHATPEQEAKRVKEGKTFKGAYEFCKSVAEKYRNKPNGDSNCVAMPDDLAYWILMEYMEHEEEGAKYRTPDEIEAEAKRKEQEAVRKRKEAEEKAAKMNENSLISTSADEVLEAERMAKFMGGRVFRRLASDNDPLVVIEGGGILSAYYVTEEEHGNFGCISGRKREERSRLRRDHYVGSTIRIDYGFSLTDNPVLG